MLELVILLFLFVACAPIFAGVGEDHRRRRRKRRRALAAAALQERRLEHRDEIQVMGGSGGRR